jgi:hypothetical protein
MLLLLLLLPPSPTMVLLLLLLLLPGLTVMAWCMQCALRKVLPATATDGCPHHGSHR